MEDLLSAALNQSGLKPEELGPGSGSAAAAAVAARVQAANVDRGSMLNSAQQNPAMHPLMAAAYMGYMNRFPMMPGGAMGGGNMPYPMAGGMPTMGYPDFWDSGKPLLQQLMMGGGMPNFPFHPEFLGRSWPPDKMMGMNKFVKTETEEGDEEEEELGHAETYADYMPAKLKVGERHPDPVVETSSLSSVPPPDVWYTLSIPEETIDRAHLSALQLEAIVYASQQHEKLLPDSSRAGFLIGDGAGVGKGRTLAGIIYENYLLGRKRAIWLSVSNDLKYDAERDLKDIGATKIEVNPLNKFKYAKISSKVNNSVKKGVIFATYSSLIGESQSGGKYRTRLKQLVHWCGEDFDGCLVFDECHKAKNLCPSGSGKPSKTGLTVLELQKKLPKARVVYASATGASEPKNMAYMTRLGLWGEGNSFREFPEFISAVEKRGVGAMELVAMDMKLRGMYIARQLSFAGVTFKIEEISLEKDFIRMYDESVKLWVDARAKFQQAIEIMDGDNRSKKTMWGQFWSSHQRFFKYLCIASKVKHAVNLAREAVKNGKCVVIGLQSTGEARTLEQLEEAGGELTDFVSTAKGVFQTLIEKHFPAPNRKKMARLLGLDTLLEEASNKGPSSPGPTTSSGVKRKPVRRARQGVKRYKEEKYSDDSSSDVPDSDFEPSPVHSEKEPSDDDDYSPEPSESEPGSDDFNPFGDDSDSDADPWLNRKSKGKNAKSKKKKKQPYSKQKEKNGEPYKPPPADAVERAIAMRDSLLAGLEKVGDSLPPNTLDQLIDDLGGPDNVAEMTGRKGRVVSTDDGTIQYESRSENDVPLETLNLTEKQRFMDGEKTIAIISEAASSGISLQADRRVKNQARRVHITLELPWSADRAIQQFGRTHRSNQVSAPEYLFLISDLAGERRFASIVAKRLESLGALTHGDRRATESRDLSRFNIDTKYGRAALETIMRAVMEMESPMVPPPADYEGDFFEDVRTALIGVGLVIEDEHTHFQVLDKDYNNMSKFLNRLLGLPVKLQNLLFKYFTDTLEAVISEAKKAGRFDLGILDLGSGQDKVKRICCNVFVQRHATGTAKTELNTVSVERGLSWDCAMDMWKGLTENDEGFYLSSQVRNNNKTAVLAVLDTGTRRSKEKRDKKDRYFRLYRPNTGLQVKPEAYPDLKSKYKKVTPDEAETHWTQQFLASEKTCSHAYWYGSCRRATMGQVCEIGLRSRTYHVLSGSVLSVWNKVESVLNSVQGAHSSKLQVVRLKTEDDLRIVGSIIPGSCMLPLINLLTQDAESTYKEEFQKDTVKKELDKNGDKIGEKDSQETDTKKEENGKPVKKIKKRKKRQLSSSDSDSSD